MRRLALAIALALVFPSAASADDSWSNGSVYATATSTAVTIGNDVAQRSFDRAAFGTTSLIDKRTGREWSSGGSDFSFVLSGAEIVSGNFSVDSVSATQLSRGGLRVVMRLRPAVADAGIEITRTVEAYPGVAGFRSETTLTSLAAGALQRYQLDRVAVGAGAAPTIQAFRAGGDWRSDDWAPPSLGDAHTGDWRAEQNGPAGQPTAGPGEWISMGEGGDSVFLVSERNDLPSSRAGYDGATANVGVDFSRDILSIGPFEESGHAENPTEVQAGRPRVLGAGVPLKLEAVFTGLATGDGDEGWQFHRYLVDHRMPAWDRDVTFNSNGTDGNVISTGAKDDMNEAMVRTVAPLAKRLGIETFIMDDGWQARSGDWCPDSPACPEPRNATDPVKFAPRFSDSTFSAVRDVLAANGGMKLGLWMNPTFFHPSAQAWKDHPEWICQPVGSGLMAYNEADQTGGSNEAGLSPWGPEALPYIESRIRDAIENWGARYFKFDFIVWLDCAGQGDLYDFHDGFVAMLDRLQATHPEVTFQIDETNDYRMVPFASVSRGPSWYLNGGPKPSESLHTIWNLSPYIPAFTLGLGAFGNSDFNTYTVDTYLAAALLSHMTFFNDLRNVPAAVIDRAGVWTAFYKRNRAAFNGVTYPLLTDPKALGWTALQNWDPAAGVGSLLAFRQSDATASKTIGLQNVPDGKTYELFDGPEETPFGTFTSQQLRDGITVSLAKNRAKALLIKEVTP